MTHDAYSMVYKVPGYPTWEINGNLYPGEKSISEINELVSDIEKGQ